MLMNFRLPKTVLSSAHIYIQGESGGTPQIENFGARRG